MGGVRPGRLLASPVGRRLSSTPATEPDRASCPTWTAFLSALFAAGFTLQVAAQATLVLDCYIRSFEGHRFDRSEPDLQPQVAAALEVLAASRWRMPRRPVWRRSSPRRPVRRRRRSST